MGRDRGTYLHTDVAPGTVVGPGGRKQHLAPLQAEGPVVHPYHMYHQGPLFIGSWHGKRIEQQPQGPSISLLQQKGGGGQPHDIPGLRKRGDQVWCELRSPLSKLAKLERLVATGKVGFQPKEFFVELRPWYYDRR